jgi:hypothetical protein
MLKLRIAVPFLLLGLLAPGAHAQTPQAEVFGGYSYLRINPGGGIPGENVPAGWHASVAGNFNSWFGLAGDFSGHYKDLFGINLNAHTFTFGPRITARGNETIQPFAHVLVGGTRVGAGLGGGISASDVGFTAIFGGGVDVKLSDRIAWRAGQFDYVVTAFGSDTQHNFRYSTGVVFRFGSK